MSENNDRNGDPVESQVHQEQPTNSGEDRDELAMSDVKEAAVASAEAGEEKLDVTPSNGVGDNDLMEVKQLRAELEKMAGEKELIEQQHKEERETIGRELGSLRRQIKVMTQEQTSPSESDGGLVDQLPSVADSSLHDLINECSQFLKTASEERLRTQGMISELNAVLPMKDQEIEDLNAKVMESSVSQDVASSYMDSIRREQLGKKEANLVDSLTHLEDENRKVMGQLDEYKLMLGQKDEELEQEKARCATAKEKLSLAVTKGKALIQQRDTLKNTLADKTSELERCLVDMQEKSIALEAADLRIEELIKSENLLTSVQETLSKRNAVLESFEEMLSQISLPKEIQSIDTSQKYKWIVDEFHGLRDVLASKESLISTLWDMIQKNDAVFGNIGDILSQTSMSEEVKETALTERIKCLVDEKNVLYSVSLEFHKLKDGLLMIDLPQHVPSSDLELRLGWLRESFYKTKDEINMLQYEIARMEETANNEIGRLSASLSAELQKSYYLQTELNDMTCKYRDIADKKGQVLREKDRMVKMVLEVSGVSMHDEGLNRSSIDTAMLFDRCIEKIKELNRSSCVDPELVERIQNFMYVRTQELMLCEELLGEDILVRSYVSNLSNELRLASQKLLALKEEKGMVKAEMDNLSNELSASSLELLALKEEKGQLRSEVDNLSNELSVASQELSVLKETKASLQEDVERSDEKAAILKDKLSMAVKKGKGLVQDRENLKHELDEKNSEIEKLRVKLQQQESAIADSRNEINRLSTDSERIPELEADIVALKDQKGQLENFLLESNDVLQRLIESIDVIILPVDSVFEEPAEKVKQIATYIKEIQDSKSLAEQELGKVKEEADLVARKLVETQTTLESVEDALSVAENDLSQLVEEKRETELAMKNAEEELKEASLQASEVAEAYSVKNSLEDAVSELTRTISVLSNEKEEAQHSRADAETELEKVKEELTVQTSKLAEAYTVRGSLEDELSGAESNIALMTEQSNNPVVGRTSLENELQKIRNKAEFHTSEMENASKTIKSLEDALSKAENNITVLEGDKKVSKQEISTLNAALSTCMDELSGTSGSLKCRTVELTGHLNDLQVLMKDQSALSIMKQCFAKKLKSLKDMDLILNIICCQLGDLGSEVLQSHPVVEDDLLMIDLLPDDLDNILSVEMRNEEADAENEDDISSNFKRTVKGLKRRNKIIAKKFEDFSVIIEELTDAVMGKLQSMRDRFLVVLEHKESLEQKLKDVEMYKQEHDNTITSLENEVKTLLSACCYATRELEFEVTNNVFEVCSIPDLEELKHSISEIEGEENGDMSSETMEHGSKYKREVKLLSLASRKAYVQTKQLDRACHVAAATIEELHNGLEEFRLDYEKVTEERDFNQNKVSKLESDIKTLQSSCRELRLKLQKYQAIENMLKEREAEHASLFKALEEKEQEMKDSLLPVSEVKIMLEKLSEIGVSFAESKIGDIEISGSVLLRKLIYTINNVTESQHQINLLSHDKEELQSTLARQSREIEHLEEEVAASTEESQNMRNELSELTLGLQKLCGILDRKDFTGDQKSADPKGILPVLEKQLMTLHWESENSKAKSQELNTKLVESHEIIQELSNKVEVLEDSKAKSQEVLEDSKARSQELDTKLVESHKIIQELSNKVKVLEDSLKGKTAQPDSVQERSISEASPPSNGSEISEIEDAGPDGKNLKSPSSSRAAQMRTMKRGSAEHLALNIDIEAAPLITEQTDEDKGHVFKSLNTSGLIPTKGKSFADRVDGIWVSGGRLLMSHPRARLGLIAYWLVVHMWLLLAIAF